LELLKFNHSIVSFDLPETLEPFSIGKTDEKKIKSIKNKYELKTLLEDYNIQNFLKI
jgi:hypothetical protein